MPEFERSLQDIKEEVRARTDIVEIVGQYTTLKKTGKNFSGLCPFHNDKKPSFSVSPQFQSYNCWSCGEKGDIFSIIQKKENLEFVEALEYLAKRAGIPFERKAGDPQKASEREQALELNRLAVGFFKDNLTRSAEGKEYLVKRALLKSTQEQWEIGFAPQDWDAFVYHLQRHKADLELANRIGLIRQGDDGKYRDFYRNRLMFPIYDGQGRLIAFGGRAMDDHPAKYMNSPESFLFHKSETLYGLYFAKKKIGGDTPPVFVEGYMDVVTTHQAGFTQCVATLGTAMTQEHAQMLKRYNPRVILCYDADRAGVGAALKGAQIWEEMGLEKAEVRVARLPNGDDPDSILRDRPNGAALFQAALDNAIPRVDFQIELAIRRHNLQTDQGRADALAELIPILATVQQSTRRDMYAQKFAFLSPLHNYDLGRAINSILADAEMYARQTNNARSPRDQGFPLTEQANQQPLQETPPPAFRGPDPRQGSNLPPGQWPNTRNTVRKGENPGQNGNGYGNNGYGGNNYNSGNGGYGRNGGERSGYGRSGYNGNGYGGRGRNRNGPIGDPTPPSTDTPVLSGVEKAERQLLRAVFSPDWRVFVLSNVRAEWLVTSYGRRLFEIAARTPSNMEGGIDPLPILHRAQNEEEGEEEEKRRKEEETEEGNTEYGIRNTESEPQSAIGNRQSAIPNTLPNKFSDFIREVLEDSPFLASNERLNETIITNCIGRLRKHRAELELRAESAALQQLEHLSPEQQRAAIAQHQEKMRELRGSPPKDEAA